MTYQSGDMISLARPSRLWAKPKALVPVCSLKVTDLLFFISLHELEGMYVLFVLANGSLGYVDVQEGDLIISPDGSERVIK